MGGQNIGNVFLGSLFCQLFAFEMKDLDTTEYEIVEVQDHEIRGLEIKNRVLGGQIAVGRGKVTKHAQMVANFH